ncbi:MAG: MotA/TolQ/ExbB proton channel family protein [Myxococcales bacterium]|nr:MotA/TolQ/ExbB proton channel family protein [Myxococcales bacterium]
MFQTMYDISLGARAGILNRFFTVAMLLLVVVQLWRLFHFRMRLSRWRDRLLLLEQEAREEGVVTVTDNKVLPPTNPYMRFWDMVPSMAIMFGLLGTFVGLTLSLSELPVTGEVDQIQKGLSRSIPSMGTAFWTSLSGLLVALTVRIANAFMASSFRKRVIQTLMQSEPAVIEALESTAFQTGRDGALLRPHSIRELLWHQNRLLNQTVARVAPQVSEGIARGLSQIGNGGAAPLPTTQQAPIDRLARQLEIQNTSLQTMIEQQQAILQQLQYLSNVWSQSGSDSTADFANQGSLDQTSVGTPSPYKGKGR